ncbi:MAG: DNA polymerase ligase N-terminal domain-containing protein [Ignavibacteria bacterium]
MSLNDYKKKRNFKKTSEPAGKIKGNPKQLIFVVQKHDASHLHYDFRLELNGVLKSWAIPKGPSLNPEDKRLAMMVEDHPFDYKDFEGTIPKGNYGAGEVIVWDNGIYLPIGGGTDKDENEKILNKALKKGDLKFVLLGSKLKGEFALVNMRKDEKSWLLIKKHDEYSKETDILKKDKSVLSGVTIEKMKKTNESKRKKA